LNEEIARVLPVLSTLRRKLPSLPLSVDTRRTEVAREALDAGADVVNVVTGLAVPDDLLQLVASRGAAVVLNHCRGTPSTTFEESSFTDVVAEVAADLSSARSRAISSGIPAERILLDPGLGFGKKADENFELLARLADVAPPGTPLVVGASRKAFLGSLADRPPKERLPESLGAAAVAARAAASHPVLLRVHDVGETIRFLATLARAQA
jgi:dihydropteroate synthase